MESDFLFCAPRFLFPYQIIVAHGFSPDDSGHFLFSYSTGLLLNFLQWSLLALGFVFIARRLKTIPSILAAIAVITLVGLTTYTTLDSLGFYLHIEAP